MKKNLLAIAAVAALSFSASAFTVEEICGEYNATGINLSQNHNIYGSGTFAGLESTSWTMTISQVEGNKVKLSNFIPTAINKSLEAYPDGYPTVSFDIEGEFDGNNTIILNTKRFLIQRPDYPNLNFINNICKYDGETAFGKKNDAYFNDGFPTTFKATFDENKNLTVEPWASYDANSFVRTLPTYGTDNTVGTYFTPKNSGDNGSSFSVEEICGQYKATGINLSQNHNIYGSGTFAGLESTSWTMTISQVEGNKVKLSNFIPTAINKSLEAYPDGYPTVSFDIEGEFDGNNTIILNTKRFLIQRPDYPNLNFINNICKYDGETAFGKKNDAYFNDGFPTTFKATFDENKNLTVEPWASYDANSFVRTLPTYGADNTVGTYFTRESSSLEDIEVESEAPVEYYNLHGIRVADPAPGLYIRRQGNKVSKVVIR